MFRPIPRLKNLKPSFSWASQMLALNRLFLDLVRQKLSRISYHTKTKACLSWAHRENSKHKFLLSRNFSFWSIGCCLAIMGVVVHWCFCTGMMRQSGGIWHAPLAALISWVTSHWLLGFSVILFSCMPQDPSTQLSQCLESLGLSDLTLLYAFIEEV